ncbi:MAG: metallophosphoesterase [Candidatus Omnitrophica bacterium]|nr:metallophosphoesterase [Candidatus Omnitrophota bacterium]
MKHRKITFILVATFILPAVFTSRVLCENSAAKSPVIIFGDSQVDHNTHRKIVSTIIKEHPVAVFQLGDQVNDGNSRQEWEVFNEITAPLRAVARYYPLLGNHEYNSPLYYENFQLPNNERWYSVDENGIRFIILDSNAPLFVGSEQYLWLENTLEQDRRGINFVILLFHHPLFTTSSSHSEDEQGWRPIIMPLLESYQVDAVFSGHCHNYERSYYHGIYFIVSGGGGSPLRDQGRRSPYSQKFVKQYHFCKLVNVGKELRVSVIDINGVSIDSFSITSKKGEYKKRPTADIQTQPVR